MTSNTQHKHQIQLVALGDLLLCGRYDDLADAGDTNRVFEPLTSLLQDADVVVANMECPLTAADIPRSDKLCLRGKPVFASAMRKAGVNVVSLANNHIFDFGFEGYLETRQVLEQADIAAVGAGKDLGEATYPAVIEKQGLRLAFLAYCDESTRPSEQADEQRCGTAPLSIGRIQSDIQRWCGKVDHVVLLFHWGLEYSPYPTPDQVAIAHAAIDAGASAIIGHHSHMLQGIETYRGKLIAYSLGNLTDSDVDWHGPSRHFTSKITPTDRETIALRLAVNQKNIELLDMLPLWLNDAGQPVPAPAEIAGKILDDVKTRSQGLAIEELQAYWQNTLLTKRVMAPFLHWWRSGSLWDKIKGFRLSQLATLYLLLETFIKVRWSRSSERWALFNPRNDKRPMPYARDNETGENE